MFWEQSLDAIDAPFALCVCVWYTYICLFIEQGLSKQSRPVPTRDGPSCFCLDRRCSLSPSQEDHCFSGKLTPSWYGCHFWVNCFPAQAASLLCASVSVPQSLTWAEEKRSRHFVRVLEKPWIFLPLRRPHLLPSRALPASGSALSGVSSNN